MALNINGTTSGIVKVVSALVGTRLSTLPTATGTRPSVILNRSKTPKPDFPYAVIDHIGINSLGQTPSDTYFDDNLDEVNEVDYTGRFLIQVHGGHNDDCLSIIQEIKSRLISTHGRNLIKENLLSSTLLSTGNIIFLPSRLSTDFEEVARFTLDLSMKDIFVDETTGTIENTILDGELYEDFEQEKPPYEVRVEVLSN